MPSYTVKRNIPTYYKYGTEPNTNIVGSFARIDRGVASGFSKSSYLNFNEYFRPGNSTWERVFCITTGASFSDHLPVDTVCPSTTNANTNYMGIEVFIMSDGKIHFWGSSTASSFNIANNVPGVTVLKPLTTYYVKTLFDGSSYKVLLSTTGEFNGEETTETNVASTTIFWQGNTIYDSIGVIGGSIDKTYNGLIDLSKSYININGQRWWSGDRYVKVGSWIEDSVVSGFSTTNYLEVANSFDVSGGKTWEIMFKVTTGSDIDTIQSICGHHSTTTNYDPVAITVEHSKFYLFLANSSSSGIVDTSGSVTVLPNTTYWIKLVFTGNQYVLSYSLDGLDYTEDISSTSSTSIWTSNLLIGQQEAQGAAYPWFGSIDLKQSYININDKLWWHGTKGYEVNLGSEDVWKKFKQPVLSSNGIMGGSSFAVASDVSQYSYNDVFNLFDKDTGYGFHSVQGAVVGYIDMYSPNPLKITNILVNNQNATGAENRASTAGNVYGSNDGSDWRLITSYTNTVQGINGQWNIDLSSNAEGYKYYRIESTACGTGGYWTIGEWTITAQELIPASSDYDYYTTETKTYVMKRSIPTYYKYGKDVYGEWKQPILSANNSSSILTVSATDEGQGAAWKAFDGDTNSEWATANNVTSGTLTAVLNKDIYITSIEVTGLKNQYGSTNTITIYSDTNKQNVIGEQKAFDYSVSDTLIWNFKEPVKANTLAFYGIGTTWVVVRNIKITAQELKQVGSSDYDYYTTAIKTYTTKRIKYKDIPNVTVTGSPTIVDNVASGFSPDNFLTLPSNFNVSNGQSWEMVFGFTTGSSFSDVETLISKTENVAYQCRFGLNNGKPVATLSNTSETGGGSSFIGMAGEEVLEKNTPYLLKFKYSDGVYGLYLSRNVKNPEWELVKSQENSTIFTSTKLNRIGYGYDTGSSSRFSFNGLINLKQSYIKINDELWWSGTRAVKY